VRLAAPVLAAALAAALAGCSGVSERPPVSFEAASFSDLAGWREGDPRPGLTAFRRGCPRAAAIRPPLALPIDAETLKARLAKACAEAESLAAADAAAVRGFFERRFAPYRVLGPNGPEGLFTGYYEPELRASRRKHGGYTVPIHGLPPGANGGAVLASRAEIETGAAGRDWPVLFWAADAVDVFTLHIQGSGRLKLDDGRYARVAYAGNNGHGYVAIGRLLRERNVLPEGGAAMPDIRAWMRANPEAGQALMRENPRYIFFRAVADAGGVVGQLGAVLTPMASLAVDTGLIPLAVPLWLETNGPAAKDQPLHLLVVAQDTGSAIKGAVRGDIFWGSGEDALAAAGRMAERGRYFLLLPR